MSRQIPPINGDPAKRPSRGEAILATVIFVTILLATAAMARAIFSEDNAFIAAALWNLAAILLLGDKVIYGRNR